MIKAIKIKDIASIITFTLRRREPHNNTKRRKSVTITLKVEFKEVSFNNMK